MPDVEIEGLSIALEKALAEYKEEVSASIEKAYADKAGELVKEIKRTSPRDTGAYAKGWTKKKQKFADGVSYLVYNKEKPQITHLLEYGHAKAGGLGRVEGIPHIGPARDKIEAELKAEIEDIIRRGG